MKELEAIRAELDAVDLELVALVEKRMALAEEVAACKQARGLPVLDASREEAVLASRVAMLKNQALAEDIRALYRLLMAQSRARQEAFLREDPSC